MRTPFRTHDVPASAESDLPDNVPADGPADAQTGVPAGPMVEASAGHDWENGNASNGRSPGEEVMGNGAAVAPRRRRLTARRPPRTLWASAP